MLSQGRQCDGNQVCSETQKDVEDKLVELWSFLETIIQ